MDIAIFGATIVVLGPHISSWSCRVEATATFSLQPFDESTIQIALSGNNRRSSVQDHCARAIFGVAVPARKVFIM
jgi:hypothetical protein